VAGWEDVCDFSWQGGEFRGHCFDPDAESNGWEPNANTRAILVTTSPGGSSRGLRFRDIRSTGIPGRVLQERDRHRQHRRRHQRLAEDVLIGDNLGVE